jgi:predicted nucleic acid-binding protein
VSNSSCVIALDAAGYIGILEPLYGTIEVPEAVAQECANALPACAKVVTVQNRAFVQSLRLQLGAGESEAIALGVERSASRMILDDKKARSIARRLNLPVTGTLAVLLRAKERGMLPAVRDAIDALNAVGFHMTDELIAEVLRLALE